MLYLDNLHAAPRTTVAIPQRFLESLPANRVRRIHLAGNGRAGEFRLYTHACPVSDDVWRLSLRELQTLVSREMFANPGQTSRVANARVRDLVSGSPREENARLARYENNHLAKVASPSRTGGDTSGGR